MEMENIIKVMDEYLNTVSDEQFEKDLIKAGAERANDLFAMAKCPKCNGNMDAEGLECMYCGFSYC